MLKQFLVIFENLETEMNFEIKCKFIGMILIKCVFN